MKIMVYNTQHCASYPAEKIDFELIAGIIKNCDADIVGLNEMRGKGTTEEYAEQTDILSSLTGIEHKYFARAIFFGGSEPCKISLKKGYDCRRQQNRHLSCGAIISKEI